MNPNDSTQQVTWSQVYTDFKGALHGAADALKTGAEHVYEVIVRQQVINSISLTITYVFMIVVVLFAWKLTHKFYLKKIEDEMELSRNDKGDWGALYVIPSIITVLTILLIVLTIKTVIMGYFNPEYGAIKEIKSFIK